MFGRSLDLTAWLYLVAVPVLVAMTPITRTGAVEPFTSEGFSQRGSDTGVQWRRVSTSQRVHPCSGPEERSGSAGGARTLSKKDRRRQIKRLGRKYLPNGQLTIMKRGAIRGNRTMENPWVVETYHYVVKTDISKKAAGEIALIMELFYHSFIQSPIFNVEKSHEKLPVLVAKNRKEFENLVSSLGRVPRTVRGLYMRSSDDRKMVTYYFHSDDMKLNHILLHEGTHQFIDMVMESQVPTWLNEGLASYFEYSRFEDLRLVEGRINDARLRSLHRMLRMEADRPGKFRVIKKFSTLMRTSGKHFNGRNYAQAWSLIHFLLNWNGGKLTGKLQKYFNTYKAKNVNQDPVQLFQEVFGFHPDKMYSPWKKYVLRLH